MTDRRTDHSMKGILAVTVSFGVALNVVAFLFALRPSALWQLLTMLLFFVALATVQIGLICIPALWGRYRLRAFVPLCTAVLCLGCLMPSLFAGFSVRNRLFRHRLDQYEAVIGMMTNGSIEVNEKLRPVELPLEYAHLAVATLAEKDSEDVLTVEFIIGGGFPAKHSGYLYRSEGTLEDWRHADSWRIRRRIDDHWYVISD